MPVPELKHTLDMYAKVLQPITTEEQYKNAERLIQEFLAPEGEGHGLQRKLLERAKSTDNWVTVSISILNVIIQSFGDFFASDEQLFCGLMIRW